MTVVVDASVIIAQFSETDVHHREAVELLSNATPPLVMHPITVAEVLVGPARQGREVEVFDAMLEIGVAVDMTPPNPIELARLRATTSLKMPDCCVLLSSSNHDAPVRSFDARLTQAAERRS